MPCNSPKDDISFDLVCSVLSYDAETGDLKWKSPRKPSSAGTTARDGYIRIKISQSKYAAHRLAWLLTYKEWPNGQIDHINRIKTDNSIKNLRLASPSENSRNRGKAKHYRRAATTGCTFLASRGKWQAQICIPGTNQKKYLGLFESKDAAMTAYQRELEVLR